MPHGACTPTDTQLCYRTCGPEGVGFDPLNCAGGFYDKLIDCKFDPSFDYSCYKIPSTANTTCPLDANPYAPPNTYAVPMASEPCAVAGCVLCNSIGGIAGGLYLDSGGAEHNGYCVCTSAGRWSCGNTTAGSTGWPCPGNPGC